MTEEKREVQLFQEKALTPEDPLKKYMREVSQYPLLTKEEELDLAQRLREHNDREAAKKLVTSHLRLVVKIANEYKTAYGNVLDLVQEGNLGLLRSIKTYDPDKGARLAHYASWWIRSYILKYILDNFRLIKIGTTQAQRNLFFNLMKEKKRIESMGFKATPERIAENLNVKASEVEEMQKRLNEGELSIDTPLNDGDGSYSDLLADDAHLPIDESLDHEKVKDILIEKIEEFSKKLNEREQKILQERLLSEVPLTLQTIADQYGISRERTRQIEERLKTKLKDFFKSAGINEEFI